MLLRGGADLALVNGIIVSPTQTCLRIASSATVRDADTALKDAGKPVYKSVAMQCLPAMPFSDTGAGARLVKSIFAADSTVTLRHTPSQVEHATGGDILCQ